MAAEVVCADVDERLAVLEAEPAEPPPLVLRPGGHDDDVHLGERGYKGTTLFYKILKQFSEIKPFSIQLMF